jgi:hypothetical protein
VDFADEGDGVEVFGAAESVEPVGLTQPVVQRARTSAAGIVPEPEPALFRSELAGVLHASAADRSTAPERKPRAWKSGGILG